MSIRKIIRKIIKESIIVESDSYPESDLEFTDIYQDSMNDTQDSFVVKEGEMSGIKFNQEIRIGSLNAARNELKKWNGKKDSDASVRSDLRKYWVSYFGRNDANVNHIVNFTNEHPVESCPQDLRNPNHSGSTTYHPWSAVFIRYCMIEGGYTSDSGAPETFNHISHEKFFVKAYMNRDKIIKEKGKSKNINDYVLFFIDEIDPRDLKPGDNVFKFRPGKSLKQSRSWFKRANLNSSINSHSDIYSGNGKCIGGNVGDTVKEYDMDSHVAVVKWISSIDLFQEGYESDILNAEKEDAALDFPRSRKA
jgi:hypothetical protein